MLDTLLQRPDLVLFIVVIIAVGRPADVLEFAGDLVQRRRYRLRENPDNQERQKHRDDEHGGDSYQKLADLSVDPRNRVRGNNRPAVSREIEGRHGAETLRPVGRMK